MEKKQSILVQNIQKQSLSNNQQERKASLNEANKANQKKKMFIESTQGYKYYPFELEPIFGFALRNIQRIIRKNIRVLLALEEKKRLGTYKPIISKEELDRIKIGLSVGISLGGQSLVSRAGNRRQSSIIQPPSPLKRVSLIGQQQNQVINISKMDQSDEDDYESKDEKSNSQARSKSPTQSQRRISKSLVPFSKDKKTAVQRLDLKEIQSPSKFKAKNSHLQTSSRHLKPKSINQNQTSKVFLQPSSPIQRKSKKLSVQTQNLTKEGNNNVDMQDHQFSPLLLEDQDVLDENKDYIIDKRYDELGQLPEYKADSDRPLAEQDQSYRQFINNQIRIQQQLLSTLNKDELTKQMEILCKDFLEAIIKSKSYDIKMSMLDIINLPKDEAGQPNPGLIKERQKQEFTISLYQDEIDDLKMKVQELRSERDKYLDKFVHAKDANKDLHNILQEMRGNYAKELQNLRESLINKQKDKNYQYTEVRFFDTVSTMDEPTKAMLQLKMSDVQRQYEDQIRSLTEKLDVFQRQIIIFEKLCEDGNMLVSLDELNALDICKKLAIVETDPKILWKAFEQVFGFGFFLPTIEEEFGITPAFKEQITKQYNEELNKARYETANKVNKFANSVKNELEIFRRMVGKKNTEMSLIHQVQVKRFEIALEEAKTLLETSFQNQLDTQVRLIRERMTRFEDKVQSQDKALKESVTDFQRANLKHVFLKWQFKAKIMNLIKDFQESVIIKRQIVDEENLKLKIFSQLASSGEQLPDFSYSYFCSCKVDGQIYKLKDIYNKYLNVNKQVKKTQLVSEYHQKAEEATEKYQENIKANALLKIKCQQLDSNNNFLRALMTNQQQVIEQLSTQLLDAQAKARITEQEQAHRNTQFEEQRYYIELLEKEMDRLNTLFKRMVASNPQTGFFQQNPMQGLEYLRLKVKNEVGNKNLKIMGRVLKEHMREKFIQTDLCDLDREIIFKPLGITDPDFNAIPKIEQSCQAGNDLAQRNHSAQTDQDLIPRSSVEVMTDLDMQTLFQLEGQSNGFEPQINLNLMNSEERNRTDEKSANRRSQIKEREKSKGDRQHRGSTVNQDPAKLMAGVNHNKKHRKTQDPRTLAMLRLEASAQESADRSHKQRAYKRSTHHNDSEQVTSREGDTMKNRLRFQNQETSQQNDGSEQDFDQSQDDQDLTQSSKQVTYDSQEEQNQFDSNPEQFERNRGDIEVGDVSLAQYKDDEIYFQDQQQSILKERENLNGNQNYSFDWQLYKQASQYNKSRFSQNGGFVQINVQPKYEIVSFNLKCLENSLNKKYPTKVQKRSRAIQTESMHYHGGINDHQLLNNGQQFWGMDSIPLTDIQIIPSSSNKKHRRLKTANHNLRTKMSKQRILMNKTQLLQDKNQEADNFQILGSRNYQKGEQSSQERKSIFSQKGGNLRTEDRFQSLNEHLSTDNADDPHLISSFLNKQSIFHNQNQMEHTNTRNVLDGSTSLLKSLKDQHDMNKEHYDRYRASDSILIEDGKKFESKSKIQRQIQQIDGEDTRRNRMALVQVNSEKRDGVKSSQQNRHGDLLFNQSFDVSLSNPVHLRVKTAMGNMRQSQKLMNKNNSTSSHQKQSTYSHTHNKTFSNALAPPVIGITNDPSSSNAHSFSNSINFTNLTSNNYGASIVSHNHSTLHIKPKSKYGNSTFQSQIQSKNRRDIQKILLQQFQSTNIELESLNDKQTANQRASGLMSSHNHSSQQSFHATKTQNQYQQQLAGDESKEKTDNKIKKGSGFRNRTKQ